MKHRIEKTCLREGGGGGGDFCQKAKIKCLDMITFALLSDARASLVLITGAKKIEMGIK